MTLPSDQTVDSNSVGVHGNGNGHVGAPASQEPGEPWTLAALLDKSTQTEAAARGAHGAAVPPLCRAVQSLQLEDALFPSSPAAPRGPTGEGARGKLHRNPGLEEEDEEQEDAGEDPEEEDEEEDEEEEEEGGGAGAAARGGKEEQQQPQQSGPEEPVRPTAVVRRLLRKEDSHDTSSSSTEEPGHALPAAAPARPDPVPCQARARPNTSNLLGEKKPLCVTAPLLSSVSPIFHSFSDPAPTSLSRLRSLTAWLNKINTTTQPIDC